MGVNPTLLSTVSLEGLHSNISLVASAASAQQPAAFPAGNPWNVAREPHARMVIPILWDVHSHPVGCPFPLLQPCHAGGRR